MGKKAKFANSIELGGKTYRPANTTVEGDTLIVNERSGDNPLPSAKAGTLTTRTSASAGEITFGAGYGIITGDRLDVYWSGGSRYGCTVGTVVGNVVPISGGQGDDLPVVTTAMTGMVPVSESLVVTGDNAIAIVITGTDGGTVVLREAGSDALAVELPTGADVYSWRLGGGTNPIASKSVVTVLYSHPSTVPADMEVAILAD